MSGQGYRSSLPVILMKYFDYESIAGEAKIPEEKLRKLVKLAGQEFPHDQMMAELHTLRACLAIRDGHIQIDEALKTRPENSL